MPRRNVYSMSLDLSVWLRYFINIYESKNFDFIFLFDDEFCYFYDQLICYLSLKNNSIYMVPLRNKGLTQMALLEKIIQNSTIRGSGGRYLYFILDQRLYNLQQALTFRLKSLLLKKKLPDCSFP